MAVLSVLIALWVQAGIRATVSMFHIVFPYTGVPYFQNSIRRLFQVNGAIHPTDFILICLSVSCAFKIFQRCFIFKDEMYKGHYLIKHYTVLSWRVSGWGGGGGVRTCMCVTVFLCLQENS